MTRIVLQGKKVYDTFENESAQEIMELHMKAQEEARIEIAACINELFEIKVDNDVAVVDLAKGLKTIDKLAKSIRDNVKFLTAEYTLVDGGETYKIGGKE